jgi:microsomal dipeptidase-like Zn-dependent dipeptidase
VLVERGWSEEHIKGYLGGNFRRVLDKIWSAGCSV